MILGFKNDVLKEKIGEVVCRMKCLIPFMPFNAPPGHMLASHWLFSHLAQGIGGMFLSS